MSERVNSLLNDLTRGCSCNELAESHSKWLCSATGQEVDLLLGALQKRHTLLDNRSAQAALDWILVSLVQRQMSDSPAGAGVADAQIHNARDIAVVDSEQVLRYSTGTTRRPLGPDEAYCIYKGRRLLRTFNP